MVNKWGLTNGPTIDHLYMDEVGLPMWLTKNRASTGFYTFVVATQLCLKITAYGFVPPDHCEKMVAENKIEVWLLNCGIHADIKEVQNVQNIDKIGKKFKKRSFEKKIETVNL